MRHDGAHAAGPATRRRQPRRESARAARRARRLGLGASMPFLFSYGTLQEAAVQQRTFGRRVPTHQDMLPGFTRTTHTVANPEFVALSGKAVHANLVCDARGGDAVPGAALEVSDADLELADRYE